MAFEPKIFPQFAALIDKLAVHATGASRASLNQAQPKWLDLSEAVDSRSALLAQLDRKELNKEFAAAVDDGLKASVTFTTVAELQHDFVAAVARDWYHLRRPRMSRMLTRAAREHGVGNDYGVLRHTLADYLRRVIEGNT